MEHNKRDEDMNENSKKHTPLTDKMTRGNSEHQNLAPNNGGKTDLANQTRHSGGSRSGTGSGMRTKKSVTGSDYDGQVAEG